MAWENPRHWFTCWHNGKIPSPSGRLLSFAEEISPVLYCLYWAVLGWFFSSLCSLNEVDDGELWRGIHSPCSQWTRHSWMFLRISALYASAICQGFFFLVKGSGKGYVWDILEAWQDWLQPSIFRIGFKIAGTLFGKPLLHDRSAWMWAFETYSLPLHAGTWRKSVGSFPSWW